MHWTPFDEVLDTPTSYRKTSLQHFPVRSRTWRCLGATQRIVLQLGCCWGYRRLLLVAQMLVSMYTLVSGPSIHCCRLVQLVRQCTGWLQQLQYCPLILKLASTWLTGLTNVQGLCTSVLHIAYLSSARRGRTKQCTQVLCGSALHLLSALHTYVNDFTTAVAASGASTACGAGSCSTACCCPLMHSACDWESNVISWLGNAPLDQYSECPNVTCRTFCSNTMHIHVCTAAS